MVEVANTTRIELDPTSEFEAALIEMVTIHRKKAKDYGSAEDPYTNFYHSAGQVQGAAGLSCEVLIGTKQARLRNLLYPTIREAANESIEDTFIDRAVYAVIALVLWKRGAYRAS